MSLVAIVGRPNVGKSTLFNRLVGHRQAIVDETAGTTRDRHYGKTDWNGKEFSIIDTGGYAVNTDDIFEDDIRRRLYAERRAEIVTTYEAELRREAFASGRIDIADTAAMRSMSYVPEVEATAEEEIVVEEILEEDIPIESADSTATN